MFPTRRDSTSVNMKNIHSQNKSQNLIKANITPGLIGKKTKTKTKLCATQISTKLKRVAKQ